MNEPVFVAGTGIISAIGNNVAECLDALENGRAGMGQMHYFDSAHRQKLPVAEVKLSNEELAQLSGLPNTKSRTALLSMIAAKEALDNAGIENIKCTYVPDLFLPIQLVAWIKQKISLLNFFLIIIKARLRDVINHECGSVTELVADAAGY